MSKQYLTRARERVACRSEALALRSNAPRPIGLDCVYDRTREAFLYRSADGAVSTEHPSGVRSTGNTPPVYDADRTAVAPRQPPAGSTVVLRAEASGGLCYVDTATGDASWDPPPGSGDLQGGTIEPVDLPSSPPPALPEGLGLGSLGGTDWWLIPSDADGVHLIVNKVTGAQRRAPWVNFRTPSGTVYFANLVTGETQWLPPHLWMEGWVWRAPFVDPMDPDLTARRGGLCEAVGLTFAHARDRGRRIDERAPLPQSVARRRVDGGAPLPRLNCTGAPSYPPDEFDTPLTHPLSTHTTFTDADLAEAKALYDIHRDYKCPSLRMGATMALRDLDRRKRVPW